MVHLFTVFLLAILVAFIAPDGLAERVTLLATFTSRASDVGRMLVSHGVDVAECTVAELAADPRNSAGLDLFLPR